MAQLQKLNVADQQLKPNQALDVLSVLTGGQPDRGQGSTAALQAALQQLGLGGMDMASMGMGEGVGASQGGNNDALALLAAALNNNVGSNQEQAPRAVTSEAAEAFNGSGGQGMDTAALAALLQQASLLQPSTTPVAAPNASAPALSSLQNMLGQLQLGGDQGSGRPAEGVDRPSPDGSDSAAAAAAAKAADEAKDQQQVAQQQAQQGQGSQQAQQGQGSVLASGDDQHKALVNALWAEMSSKQTGATPEMLRSAKALLESLNIFGKGGPDATSMAQLSSAFAAGAEESMNRSTSFDK